MKNLAKKIIPILSLGIANSYSFAQVNLVPNPSFEDTVSCPYSENQVTFSNGWSGNISGTPDYFNPCASVPDFSVPTNWGGYQQAASGNAYCALGTYAQNGPDFREIIYGQLSSPLVVGTKYYASLKVALSISNPILVNCATNNLGIGFSNSPINSTTNNVQVYSTNIITDTINWVTIFGSFIADSNYQYINIGNLLNDSNTNTLIMTADTFCNAYYYVDDICVSTDSLFTVNYSYTGINENLNQSICKIYPNPANNFVTIRFNSLMGIKKRELIIYNSIGQQIKQMEVNVNDEILLIDTKDFLDGVYYLQIINSNESFIQKLIINH